MLSQQTPFRVMESNSWPCTGHHRNHTLCPRVLSKCFLSSCCSDHWPGEPVQCSSTLQGKNILLLSSLNLPQLSFMLFPWVLTLKVCWTCNKKMMTVDIYLVTRNVWQSLQQISSISKHQQQQPSAICRALWERGCSKTCSGIWCICNILYCVLRFSPLLKV